MKCLEEDATRNGNSVQNINTKSTYFISDLHLHPNHPLITQRFYDCLEQVKIHAHTLYILGDFFHVWAGDDTFDTWSLGIVDALAALTARGISVYMMVGNRDFLLGEVFAKKTGVHFLADPSVIRLGKHKVLLTHGDRYCTDDTGHQWLRRLTRNRFFPRIFLRIPVAWRMSIVGRVRAYSQSHRMKPIRYLGVNTDLLIKQMTYYGCNVVIHGHTHDCAVHTHMSNNIPYLRYVLSDWDDKPSYLIYNDAINFCFT